MDPAIPYPTEVYSTTTTWTVFDKDSSTTFAVDDTFLDLTASTWERFTFKATGVTPSHAAKL